MRARLALAAGLMLASGGALALCSAPTPKVCGEFFRSDAVFLGKVVAKKRSGQDRADVGEIEFTVEVERTYKGKASRTQKVVTEDASARWMAEVGERRVVFAQNGRVGGCGPIDEPGAVVQTIREIHALGAARSASIEGQVVTDGGNKDAGARGVEIRAAGNGAKFRAVTDASGNFHMKVPPGRYRLEPEKELAATVYSLDRGGVFDVARGQCVQVQLTTGAP